MSVGILMAKLAGIRKAVVSVLDENLSLHAGKNQIRSREKYDVESVQHYFSQANDHLIGLRQAIPALYGDFRPIETVAGVNMTLSPNDPKPNFFGRQQLERLVRDIDQIFEIRANSQLQQPVLVPKRVFITHGRANDWRVVKDYIEHDVGLSTIELAQQPNLGRTIFEKLEDGAASCDSAVIVMSGDDLTADEQVRVRENVMHEIGFFQGRYGRQHVVLLHEEGVNVPTNLGGIAYVAFPKGSVESSFHVLHRELKAMYKQGG